MVTTATQSGLFAEPARESVGKVRVPLSGIDARLCQVAAVNAALIQAGYREDAAAFLRGARGLSGPALAEHARGFVTVE